MLDAALGTRALIDRPWFIAVVVGFTILLKKQLGHRLRFARPEGRVYWQVKGSELVGYPRLGR
jgi:hypothetical protein